MADVDLILLVVGVLGLAVAALSAQLRRLPVSEPLLALLAGAALATTGLLDLPTLTEDPALLHEPTRLLLAVSVMAVALRYPAAVARRRAARLALLLLVVMPLMAAVSAALAGLVLGLSLGAAVLLGAAVAPTDPVLASSVVTGEDAERDLPAADRELLSLESAANDGLALPLVLVAVAVAGGLSGPEAALEATWQVVGAMALGVVAGLLGALALRVGERHGAAAPAPALLFTLVLALATLGTAGLIGVDGVLAVFVAGLAYNAATSAEDRSREVSIDEAVNRFAVLPLFVLFGAVLPCDAWQDLGWSGAALVAAVLVLRRLPAVLALAPALGLEPRDALYLGWFGPIGVSALFYLTLEAERVSLPSTVLAAGALVIAASTVVHGLSATAGRTLYAAAARR